MPRDTTEKVALDFRSYPKNMEEKRQSKRSSRALGTSKKNKHMNQSKTPKPGRPLLNHIDGA